jgi:3-oxoacyl-[acyl-carrier protein] reductase
VDMVTEAGQKLGGEIGSITTYQVDLADAEAVHRVLGPVFSTDEAPDVLVNAVGWSPKFDPNGEPWRIYTVPLDLWRKVLAVNLDSCLLCSRLAVPKMRARGQGRIINIGALAARTGGGVAFARLGIAPGHYVTSKAALMGLTKALATELGAFGINVNIVNPGRIDTPMAREVPDVINEGFIPHIPLGRLGRPEDVADAALFLASNLAGYITGASIEVNGGLSMAA